MISLVRLISRIGLSRLDPKKFQTWSEIAKRVFCENIVAFDRSMPAIAMQTLSPIMATCGNRAINSACGMSPFRYAR